MVDVTRVVAPHHGAHLLLGPGQREQIVMRQKWRDRQLEDFDDKLCARSPPARRCTSMQHNGVELKVQRSGQSDGDPINLL